MRLLIVEDDEPLSAVLARGLRKHAFAVDVAHDGDEALYMAATASYDLVVLDVMLPGRDGFSVCEALRATGSDVPILMLTARDAVEDRVAGLDRGADDYLVKPFDFDELLARIRALLRRRRAFQGTLLSVGDLELDTATHRARRAERPIRLTAREFAMLEFLMINAGRVVGRAEIAEHVWDANYDPFSNVIEVYIRRLRRKIDGNGERPLIRTRRGAGYLITDRSDSAALEESEEEA